VFVLLVFEFVFAGSSTVLAATSPVLVGSSSYSVLGATTVTCTGATNVTGDVGVAPGAAITGFPVPCTVSPGTTQSNTASSIAAQADNLAAFGTLDTGANADANCIGGILPDGTNLTLLSPLGPGLYCSAGSFSLTGNLTLSGAGPWVFKMVSALNTSPGSSVTGGNACDVWWRVGSTATLGTTTSFEGNILALTSVILNTGATLNGRAMAQTAAVTLDANTISAPACGGLGHIFVQVPPAPPLISITKIPTPLELPAGPGSVTYDYAVSNAGVVAMSNITVTDNSCPSVSFISGDINGNSLLDVNEVWHYRCTVALSQTTTNTATATGQANGLTARDTANATVVVGLPIVPPLIHLVKRPNLFDLPYNGAVTYTYTVTNPGTVALSNVKVVDDRCGPVAGPSGDANNNNMLDVSETWTYTCQTNLTANTTNTATASGSANGLTAVDSSAVTVLVSSLPIPATIRPSKIIYGLPNTGYPPEEKSDLLNMVIIFGAFILFGALVSVLDKKKAEK
jgi:uncharacterized repeat protein (TIGR01451 family)